MKRTLLILTIATLVALPAATAPAKKSPLSGYSLTITFDDSESKPHEVVKRGACGGFDRDLKQASVITGTLKLSNLGSGLFAKPTGSWTEVQTLNDSAAGCQTVNQVDTPRAASCTITSKVKVTPSDSGGYAGVGFQKSGKSYVITTNSPQLAGVPTTKCSPSGLSADAVGGALSGFSSVLKGRVSANTIERKKSFKTTLLSQTKDEAEFEKYMCGTDPPAETSCETDLRVKALVEMTYKRK